MSKRYHPPQTPCDRLLQAESIPDAAKTKLREVASALDPLKLLEEIRAMQAHLVALADGGEIYAYRGSHCNARTPRSLWLRC